MKNTFASSVRQWLRGLVVCAAALSGSAQAAVYSGVWDPTFGAPFTNLGWRGTATYFVPDFCLPTGTADVNNMYDCDGQAIITSAQVEFYDASPEEDFYAASAEDPSPPTIATLVFNPASMIIGTLRFVSGALTQLSTTGDADFVNPEADLWAFGVGPNVEFSLFFALDEDPLRSPRLAWQDCSHYAAASKCPRNVNDFINFPSTSFTITLVPEPGTLALAALALLVLAPRRTRAALLSRRA